MQQYGPIFDDLEDVFDTWSRRSCWLYACRPPLWRPIKRMRWAKLKREIDRPYYKW